MDLGRTSRATTPLIPSAVELATVGYLDDQTGLPEPTPAWVRWEQGEAVVEITTKDEDRITARVGIPQLTLRFGQQVLIVLVDGDPQMAVIVGALGDANVPAPSSVAGVPTGAAAATDKGVRPPGATWHFLRLDDGQAFAIQTQAGGDVLIHAGASIHLRANPREGAVHLEGTVHLGVAPTTAPIGSEAGPSGEEIPGAPALPHVPVPYAPPSPQPPAGVAYVGSADGIVRAHDLYQSGVAIDPTFWAWVIAVDAVARAVNPALPPMPSNLYSAISGAGGLGSKHTATGEPEPV